MSLPPALIDCTGPPGAVGCGPLVGAHRSEQVDIATGHQRDLARRAAPGRIDTPAHGYAAGRRQRDGSAAARRNAWRGGRRWHGARRLDPALRESTPLFGLENAVDHQRAITEIHHAGDATWIGPVTQGLPWHRLSGLAHDTMAAPAGAQRCHQHRPRLLPAQRSPLMKPLFTLPFCGAHLSPNRFLPRAAGSPPPVAEVIGSSLRPPPSRDNQGESGGPLRNRNRRGRRSRAAGRVRRWVHVAVADEPGQRGEECARRPRSAGRRAGSLLADGWR